MAEVGAHRGRLIPLNEDRRRIGQGNPRCTISDAIVKQLRDLHELEGLGKRVLARRFALKVSTVQKILAYTRRGQIPREWVRETPKASQCDE